MAEFMSPYQAGKMLSGVIPANRDARPNFLQTWFSRVETSNKETVNFDKEFQTKNTVAMYVAPRVDAPLVTLQGFGTQELRFAYVKEGLTSSDWEEISGRQLGQEFGSDDWYANWVAAMQKKLAITEFNFENLFELNAANIIVNGAHTASSPLHETVVYNFNRTVIGNNDDASYIKGIVPQIDLTQLVGNGGAGKRAWDATGFTKAPTPYKDLIKACNTVRRRGSIGAVLLSGTAWDYLEADINANYSKAADNTITTETRVSLIVTPTVEKYQDLNFRRVLPLGDGSYVDVYTYDAVYHDRNTGAETPYIPAGKMIVLPSKDKGIKVYGRILHPDAGFQAQPRFINTWKDQKTGKMESEIHMNYLMGHTDIDTVVCWQVTAS